METGKPDDLRLFNLYPILVLIVSALEMLNPVDQILETLGRSH